MPQFEYCIRYAASSNVTFHNEHDAEWSEWEGDEETAEAVEQALNENEIPGQIYNAPIGLDEALAISGFEWWVEVREIHGE